MDHLPHIPLYIVSENTVGNISTLYGLLSAPTQGQNGAVSTR